MAMIDYCHQTTIVIGVSSGLGAEFAAPPISATGHRH